MELSLHSEISPRKGILGSEWVGLKYFKQFFTTPSSRKIIFNTLYLGICSLIAGFPDSDSSGNSVKRDEKQEV